MVLAHPERGARILEGDGAAVRHQIAQGSALQVNASSLAGGHGDGPRVAAARLLLERLATLLGSDAHSLSRAPALTIGLMSAARIGLEPTAAASLVTSEPRQLLTRGIPERPALPAAAMRMDHLDHRFTLSAVHIKSDRNRSEHDKSLQSLALVRVGATVTVLAST